MHGEKELPHHCVGYGRNAPDIGQDHCPGHCARDIRAASERGIHVVYCTGRAVPELKLYFDMVPMMRYAVCSTGALVYDRVEKHCIDRRPVKSEMAAALAETAKRYHAMPHILTDDETIVAADDVTHMKDFHAGIYQPMFERITRKVADMAEEARHLTSIGKVNIYFRSSEDCHACYEELRTLPCPLRCRRRLH